MCLASFECTPSKTKGTWRCRRPASHGGRCETGPDANGNCCMAIPPCRPIQTLRAKRAALSKWSALALFGVLALGFGFAQDLQPLMPGPLTTAHGSIGKCVTCHSAIGEGKFGWLHAAFTAANPTKDAKACLTCHSMSENGLNPHGVEVARLRAYTKRLESKAAAKTENNRTRIRNALFPIGKMHEQGVYCATCHAEHLGANHDLTGVSDARCQTCHAVQFTSFSSDHPDFDSYPFRRRTRINFDHDSHFGKHFPEWKAKKTAQGGTPGVCADCHTSTLEKGHMRVKPFGEVCASCHLGQIVGRERASGPKGFALLSLPGLDLDTLKEKDVKIGEWPSEAEGEISPLMRLLIGWDVKRRQLLKDVSKLDLLDLSEASAAEIARVEELALEIKHLFYALITMRRSEVLKRLGSGTDARVDPQLVADLTANIPRDVITAAQQEWLPGLASEIDRTRFEAWLREAGANPAATAFPAGDQNKPANQTKPKPRQAAHSGSWRIDPFGRLIKGNAPPEDDDENADDEPAEASHFADAGASGPGASGEARDAESWADSGGWYRQDFAILYRPIGHADRFMKSWLDLSAGLFRQSDASHTALVFNRLTEKEAQGSCTKCHSIDARKNQSRVINWQPSTQAKRDSLFTRFDHTPHFGVIGEKGCLTCHQLSGKKGFQESYKGNDPFAFVSNFKQIDRQKCASCHTGKEARQDCRLCHKYHPFGVKTPIITTKLPTK